jgi:S1-C subfamily serine protease
MYRIAVPCCFALVVLCFLTPARGDGLKDVAALEKAFQEAIQEAEPAVACILVSRSETYAKLRVPGSEPLSSGKLGDFDVDLMQRHFPQYTRTELQKLDMRQPVYVPESYGSGVVLDESGLILTNYHVVKDATKLFVRLPGDKHGYTDIYAADPRSDLAVLRLIKLPAGLKALKIGDGSKVKKGQFVLSIANPFAAGFRDGSPSASWGIISNVRRRAPTPVSDAPTEIDRRSEIEQKKTLHHYGTLLQTDARLNLGCSGGALIDLKGELIGLTTALAAINGSETTGGFAVPMDAGMRGIIDVLKRGEEVEYGFLGIAMGDTAGGGVRINTVTSGSPADRGGVRANDVIVKVNDMPTGDHDGLLLAVGTLLAGSEAKIEVRRDGVLRTCTVTLAKFYVQGPIIATRKPAAVRGLRIDHVSVLIQALNSKNAPSVHIPSGVMVREVLPNSAAATAMLKVNDVITHVNGKAVSTPKEFYEATLNEKGPLTLTLDPARQVKLN